MQKLDGTTFYAIWNKVVLESENRNKLITIWRNRTAFTHLILGSENSIISQVAKKLNLLSYEADYYSIDTILYEEKDLIENPSRGKFWFKDIKVAFEHENDAKSGLYQEVAHLLITNCELKVLVTYPNDTPWEEMTYLHEIIKSTRFSKEISEKENFLLIFGYENEFQWEGFVYNEMDWVKVKDGSYLNCATPTF